MFRGQEEYFKWLIAKINPEFMIKPYNRKFLKIHFLNYKSNLRISKLMEQFSKHYKRW